MQVASIRYRFMLTVPYWQKLHELCVQVACLLPLLVQSIGRSAGRMEWLLRRHSNSDNQDSQQQYIAAAQKLKGYYDLAKVNVWQGYSSDISLAIRYTS